MKKIVLFIFTMFFVNTVYAETILDNYVIDIKYDGPKVHVIETFNVISTSEDELFTKQVELNYHDYKMLQNNIEDYEVTVEDASHIWSLYIVGKIEENKSYTIEYVTDYTNWNQPKYAFYNPKSTIINNLTFKIEKNEFNDSIQVYGFVNETYEVFSDNNIITGKLINQTENANFTVDVGLSEKYKEKTEESQERIESIVGIILTIIVFAIYITIFIYLKKYIYN